MAETSRQFDLCTVPDARGDGRAARVAGAAARRLAAFDGEAPRPAVDDREEAVVAAADAYDSPEPLNVGSGTEVSIRELAQRTARAAGYRGRITWDTARPDGVPRRSLEVSRARALLGFEPAVSLDEGLARTVQWWRAQEHG